MNTSTAGPARQRLGVPHRSLAGSAVALLSLLAVAGAIASGPATRNYAGVTSEHPVNGFRAPVAFRVSTNDRQLLKFQYSTQGCFGSGGFRGDVFKSRADIVRVGLVKLSQTGSFSVKGAKSTFETHGDRTVSRSSVSGRLSGAGRATGRITYTQTFTDPQAAGSTCGPLSFTFSAKLG